MTYTTTVPLRGAESAPKALSRLLTYVDHHEDGCWRWSRYVDRDGYGRANVAGRSYGAHRAVYELTVGPIPKGYQLHHVCEVRNCVNPTHLHPITPADHNRIRAAAKTHCVHGHEYDERNTYRKPSGHRDCRKCGAARQRRYQARKKAA